MLVWQKKYQHGQSRLRSGFVCRFFCYCICRYLPLCQLCCFCSPLKVVHLPLALIIIDVTGWCTFQISLNLTIVTSVMWWLWCLHFVLINRGAIENQRFVCFGGLWNCRTRWGSAMFFVFTPLLFRVWKFWKVRPSSPFGDKGYDKGFEKGYDKGYGKGGYGWEAGSPRLCDTVRSSVFLRF